MHAPKAATAAHDAERALQKDDCPAMKAAVAQAGDAIPQGDPARGALENAVNAFCDFEGGS